MLNGVVVGLSLIVYAVRHPSSMIVRPMGVCLSGPVGILSDEMSMRPSCVGVASGPMRLRSGDLIMACVDVVGVQGSPLPASAHPQRLAWC